MCGWDLTGLESFVKGFGIFGKVGSLNSIRWRRVKIFYW